MGGSVSGRVLNINPLIGINETMKAFRPPPPPPPPPPPAPPPPPPAPPTAVQEDTSRAKETQEEARRSELKKATARRGRASTIASRTNILGGAETTGTINLLGQ